MYSWSVISSPLYRLNRAVALAGAGDPRQALTELDVIASDAALGDYLYLGSVRGRVLEKMGRPEAARDAYQHALEHAKAPHAKAVLMRHIQRLTH